MSDFMAKMHQIPRGAYSVSETLGGFKLAYF